ncbi:hypothetical protein OG345_41085 (plasmid) [Streptomyces sp. NBC_01220]|uniref:hypothetical protein n=1 Tax=Streptomyces sp. NBC_01220 TaxID=2903781 RepID=UPI002F9118E5|nr:hypothetical protein OG345_41085 [Streptomyces sp. NBC_01220]
MTKFQAPIVQTVRTIGANTLLDTLTSIGGIAAGTAAGRWAHQRTGDLHSPTARLSAATVVGLTAALLTDGLISGLATPLRRKIDTQPRPSAVSGDVRAEVARSACNDAAFTASFRWAVGDTGSKGYLKSRDLWRGYEDGTATYCLSPGTYLRFQPAHHEVGTKHSVGWTEQFTLESAEGTTAITGAAHLLEVLAVEEAGDESAGQTIDAADRALPALNGDLHDAHSADAADAGPAALRNDGDMPSRA